MGDSELRRLFSLVREGDRYAFAQIYEAIKQPVFTVCWRIVRSKELAEDITHDVFVKLFLSPPEPSVRNPRAWIFRMARNLAIDALRKKENNPCGQLDEDFVIDPQDLDLKLDMEAAICSLSRIEREILTMHLIGQLNFSEIGRIVGLSLPSVYRKYRKALTRLRDILNGGSL